MTNIDAKVYVSKIILKFKIWMFKNYKNKRIV